MCGKGAVAVAVVRRYGKVAGWVAGTGAGRVCGKGVQGWVQDGCA